MAIIDITNPTTTAGAVTRGIELGLELVGFGMLCSVKKDTKEIRQKESDILAMARNIEADVKVAKTNTTSVLNWIGKVDPVIMGTHKPVEQPAQPQQVVQQAPVQPVPQQVVPAPVQQPVQQVAPPAPQSPVQPAPAPQQNIVVMPQAAPAQQVVPQQETAAVQQTVQQAPVQQPVQQPVPVITEAQLNAAVEAAAKNAVEAYIASQQNNNTDANKGGKK